MYLAAKPDQLISVAEFATFNTISRNYLVKVVQGFLNTVLLKRFAVNMAGCNWLKLAVKLQLIELFETWKTILRLWNV